MEISIIKIRRSWDLLILIMRIAILVRQHIYIETAPGVSQRFLPVVSKQQNTKKHKLKKSYGILPYISRILILVRGATSVFHLFLQCCVIYKQMWKTTDAILVGIFMYIFIAFTHTHTRIYIYIYIYSILMVSFVDIIKIRTLYELILGRN